MEFKPSDVPKRGADINILASIDKHLVGGMTYSIHRKHRDTGNVLHRNLDERFKLTQQFLNALTVSDRKVQSTKLHRNKIVIEFM